MRENTPAAWGSLLVAGVLGLLLGPVGPALGAATLYVANNGIDGENRCLDARVPCRSISHAISKADAGDKIVVGPGRYGDLNEDGMFTPADGEEAGDLEDLGGGVMLKINKTLTLESTAGAGATVLNAGRASVAVVHIEADNVVFGTRQRGFTLTGGQFGMVIAGGTKVNVESNVARGNKQDGFFVIGREHVLTANAARTNGDAGFFVAFGSGHTLDANVATDNTGAGFAVAGSENTLTNNFASANREGFALVSGGEHRLTGNVANASRESGFRINCCENRLTGNVASANGSFGFDIGLDVFLRRPFEEKSRSSLREFRRNAALGNRLGGILVFDFNVRLTESNLFGNGAGAAGGNCGLANRSEGEVSAPRNFWGAADGPGDDPADALCDAPGSSTAFTPVANKAFDIPVRVGR
jgi:parallel beta-helix repeat protein